MKQVLETKISLICEILATQDRLPGYHALKRRHVLPQLKRALIKCEDGTYGMCDDCDEKISEERLKAVPGATRCTTCQGIFENLFI
jgi:RNA polymerase-binding transcription factor DksA